MLKGEKTRIIIAGIALLFVLGITVFADGTTGAGGTLVGGPVLTLFPLLIIILCKFINVLIQYLRECAECFFVLCNVSTYTYLFHLQKDMCMKLHLLNLHNDLYRKEFQQYHPSTYKQVGSFRQFVCSKSSATHPLTVQAYQYPNIRCVLHPVKAD